MLGLAGLGGMVMLVVDTGVFLYERRSLQNAADAATLAGARELCLSPLAAQVTATDWAQRNGIDQGLGELSGIQFGLFNGAEAIRVEVQRDVDYYFWFFSGITGADVHADARSVGACRGNLRPWGLVEAAVAGILPGASLTLTKSTGLGVPGTYYALAIDGSDPATYTNTIRNGSLNALCAEDNAIFRLLFEGDEGYEAPSATCPSDVAVLGGLTATDTQSAVEWLINNTKTACDTFIEVFQVVVPPPLPPSTELIEFKDRQECDPNEPYNNTDSRRVITVPIVKEIILLGQTEVEVVGFATLWLESINCPPLGLGECEIVTVLVDFSARTPWYKTARLVE